LVLVEEEDNSTRCAYKLQGYKTGLVLSIERPPLRADITVDGWDSEIIRLEEGNEYKEGVQSFKCSWAGT
jgi:hypothetical protein